MHLTLYVAVMLTLSTIIALLSLLLMVLERQPQGQSIAMEQPLELDELGPGTGGVAQGPACHSAGRLGPAG